MFILDITFYFHVMPLVFAFRQPQSHVMITLEEKKKITGHMSRKGDVHHHTISIALQRIFLTKPAQSEHLLFNHEEKQDCFTSWSLTVHSRAPYTLSK